MKRRIIKINLGSGPDGINGWINYDWGLLPLLNKLNLMKYLVRFGVLDKDYLKKWPKFNLCDIRKKLPQKDSSVSFVYCSHVLEHLEKNEAKSVIKEARRILKVGGVLRLVLPDIRIIAKISDTDEMCRKWWGYDKDKIKGMKRYFVRGHKWMYDIDSIKKLLRECEFSVVEKCNFGQGNMPDINKLDLKLHQSLSLYVEAKK